MIVVGVHTSRHIQLVVMNLHIASILAIPVTILFTRLSKYSSLIVIVSTASGVLNICSSAMHTVRCLVVVVVD